MTMHSDGITPNARRLLWAGFCAILAAGIGFGIRANIGGQWRAEFGFTETVIGDIGTAGFPGFCFGIIAGGLVCDRFGYSKLVIAAFVMHLVSAVSAFGATKENAHQVLWWGSFVFGLANGTLEAVANPLVATLFPQRRTHYLNILHASWPAGLVLGSLAVLAFPGWDWRVLLTVFLVATVAYGVLFLRQAMPKSEATRQGLGFATMFRDVGILGALVICALLSQFLAGALGLPAWLGYGIAGALVVVAGIATNFAMGSWLLFTLFVTHLLVGAVELGTDFWAADITGNFTKPSYGTIVFVFTSAIMFGLRFCAGAIEKVLSPVGILLASAVIACIGLNLAAGIETLGGALLAMGVYALGKTFFWPTMLAVASDRFPRTGAIAISLMGGIGMLSAGVLGGPGLGYAKDRFAGAELRAADPALHARAEAKEPSRFLLFDEVRGIDGRVRSEAQQRLDAARAGGADTAAALATLSPDDRTVIAASIAADRRTLRVDSLIPAAMAAIYLLLALWFKARGGYRVLRVEDAGT